jgi:YggT family protein
MRQVLCNIVQIYILVLFLRAILSWFPLRPGSPMVGVYRVLRSITDPVIEPVRRIVPQVGMLDISFLIVALVLQLILRPLICG